MDAQQKAIAQNCKDAAENNTMAFPQIIGILLESGFESYTVDFRRQTATYYLPNGESVEFKTHGTVIPVTAALDVTTLGAATRDRSSRVSSNRSMNSSRSTSLNCSSRALDFSR